MIQGCKNPIAEGDFKWIFACDCEGTEQLQYNYIAFVSYLNRLSSLNILQYSHNLSIEAQKHDWRNK